MASASTAALTIQRPYAPAKVGMLIFFAAMLVYVLQHNERFLIDRSDPFWEHIATFKWWLLPHGLAGATALLLGPMQFSDRLRSRFTKLHRVAGRFYVAAVCIAAPLGFYIQYFQERMGAPRSFTLAGAVDATLWMGTTLVAFAFILKGRVEQHRQWMTRSFFVAIVFLEVRVISGIGGFDNDLHMTETIVWMCLAFALLAADITLQTQELLKRRPKAAKASA